MGIYLHEDNAGQLYLETPELAFRLSANTQHPGNSFRNDAETWDKEWGLEQVADEDIMQPSFFEEGEVTVIAAYEKGDVSIVRTPSSQAAAAYLGDDLPEKMRP